MKYLKQLQVLGNCLWLSVHSKNLICQCLFENHISDDYKCLSAFNFGSSIDKIDLFVTAIGYCTSMQISQDSMVVGTSNTSDSHGILYNRNPPVPFVAVIGVDGYHPKTRTDRNRITACEPRALRKSVVWQQRLPLGDQVVVQPLVAETFLHNRHLRRRETGM